MKEDIASQLERVAKLHESGSLSDEEFEKAKSKILGKPEPDSRSPASSPVSNQAGYGNQNYGNPLPRQPLPRPFQQFSQNDDLGRAANRWVSLQTVMSVVALIVGCIFGLVMCSKMNNHERQFKERIHSFPVR